MKAIIVFFDSLNKHFLRCYNPSTEVESPNFTRLAEKTCTFDNSYIGSMPCIPARREMHTGRYNFLHREWGPIEPFDDSMPELLKKQGVYTHMVSDHLHYWEDGGSNYHTRYNSWDAVRGQEGDHWIGQVKEPEIPEVAMVPQAMTGKGDSSLWRYDWVNRQFIVNEEDFPQTLTFDRGIDFIERNKEEDGWLLQIETFDPHEPFYAPDSYREKQQDYKGKHFDWPRGKALQSSEEIAHVQDEYRSLVRMCDHNLGKVLDIMDRHDLWKDTMLIVGTDHGFLLGEHGYWGKNIMPYYNEIANTPLFIHDPRANLAGERRQQLVQLIDWAPTLLSYFGQDIPQDMQGLDLAKVLKSDAPTRDYVLFGVHSGHVNITDGRYIFMKAAKPALKDEVYNYTLMPAHMTKRFTVSELKTLELHNGFAFTKGLKVLKVKASEKYPVAEFGDLLFDITVDPEQNETLDNPEIVKRMRDAMVQLMKENDAPTEQYTRLGLN